MKRTWMATVVLAAGMSPVLFGQQYPQAYPQDPAYQNNPDYYGQYDNGQYNGQYGDPNAGAYDPNYNGEGVYAPPPPVAPPAYAYQRPPMPGPGYFWVDGYWNFLGGRYVWVGGYWMLPPYAGAYWVAPHYSSGRFFLGFWGGSRGRDFRYSNRVVIPRPAFRPPARVDNHFTGNDNRFRGNDNRFRGNDNHFQSNQNRSRGNESHGSSNRGNSGNHGGRR